MFQQTPRQQRRTTTRPEQRFQPTQIAASQVCYSALVEYFNITFFLYFLCHIKFAYQMEPLAVRLQNLNILCDTIETHIKHISSAQQVR